MEEANFTRLVTLIFGVLGVVDIAVGLGFAFGADYFGLDRGIAWIAGGLFVFMGIGMLAFVVLRRGAVRR